MPSKYVPVPTRIMVCEACGRNYPSRRAGRKYCSKTCSSNAAAARETKPCSIHGCPRMKHAKGLCKAHYHAQLPSRHKKIALVCDCCGIMVYKEARQRRHKRTYCSELCRDYGQWGARSTKLPKDHWVFVLGATCAWTPPKSFNCGWCEAPGIVTGRRDTYCSDPCRFRAKRARRRAKQYGATGTFTWGQVVALWAGFEKCCAYCRQPVSLDDVQAEHVIALARGGGNNIGNILPSCALCNADKRDLAMDEWKADRERRGLPPVVTHWAWSDPRYNHLAGQAMGLAA